MARLASWLPTLLALPLCLGAGCATDDEVETDVAASTVPGASCTVRLPIGWSSASATCVDDTGSGTIVLGDQETLRAFSTSEPGMGRGHTTLLCDGGVLRTTNRVCIPGSGGSEP